MRKFLIIVGNIAYVIDHNYKLQKKIRKVYNEDGSYTNEINEAIKIYHVDFKRRGLACGNSLKDGIKNLQLELEKELNELFNKKS